MECPQSDLGIYISWGRDTWFFPSTTLQNKSCKISSSPPHRVEHDECIGQTANDKEHPAVTAGAQKVNDPVSAPSLYIIRPCSYRLEMELAFLHVAGAAPSVGTAAWAAANCCISGVKYAAMWVSQQGFFYAPAGVQLADRHYRFDITHVTLYTYVIHTLMIMFCTYVAYMIYLYIVLMQDFNLHVCGVLGRDGQQQTLQGPLPGEAGSSKTYWKQRVLMQMSMLSGDLCLMTSSRCNPPLRQSHKDRLIIQ